MRTRIISLLSILLMLISCVCGQDTQNRSHNIPIEIDAVDTRTGTDKSSITSASRFGQNTENYGQTLPAVLQPNGMTFWTPQTRASEKKGVSPYYYGDQKLQGIRASHWLVGGATQDYGSFTISAVRRKVTTPTLLATSFSHEDETATPAYYSVVLLDEKIQMEMTGLSRSAIIRITVQEEGRMYVVLNCNSDEDMASLTFDGERNLVFASNPVHRIYQGWGEEAGFSGHLAMTIDKRPVKSEEFHEKDSSTGLMARGILLAFDMEQGETLKVKAATSFVSTEHALMNMQQEIPHWDFNAVRRQLTSIWEEQFSKIQVETTDQEALRKFYGSMYRCSFLPRTISDVDGSYPSFAASKDAPFTVEHAEEGHIHYCDFSLWDTYRAMHPLLIILSPSKSADMMQSLVDMYRQGGWMPIFPCWNSYTSAMIGDHVASVPDGHWLRYTGRAVFETDPKYAEMALEAMPVLRNIYNEQTGHKMMMFHIEDATAVEIAMMGDGESLL